MHQQGRVALVTGARQGIGAAIARRLAADGASVGVNDRVDDDGLAKVVADTAGFAAAADVADPDAVRDLVARIERDRGPVDIAVCNAAYMTMAPFGEHADDDWWKVVDTNIGGAFNIIQAILPGMRRRGGG